MRLEDRLNLQWALNDCFEKHDMLALAEFGPEAAVYASVVAGIAIGIELVKRHPEYAQALLVAIDHARPAAVAEDLPLSVPLALTQDGTDGD